MNTTYNKKLAAAAQALYTRLIRVHDSNDQQAQWNALSDYLEGQNTLIPQLPVMQQEFLASRARNLAVKFLGVR